MSTVGHISQLTEHFSLINKTFLREISPTVAATTSSTSPPLSSPRSGGRYNISSRCALLHHHQDSESLELMFRSLKISGGSSWSEIIMSIEMSDSASLQVSSFLGTINLSNNPGLAPPWWPEFHGTANVRQLSAAYCNALHLHWNLTSPANKIQGNFDSKWNNLFHWLILRVLMWPCIYNGNILSQSQTTLLLL